MRGLCLSVACIFMAAVMAMILGGCTEGTGAGNGDTAETTAATETTETTSISGIDSEYYNGTLKKTFRYDEGFQFYGMNDSDGNVILEAIYLTVYPISESRIVALHPGNHKEWVFNDGSMWIFDAEGNTISPGEYRHIYYLTNEDGTRGLGVAEQYIPDGDAGRFFFLVDQDGKKVSKAYDSITDEVFDDNGDFVKGLLMVSDSDGKYYFIDHQGNLIER